MAGEDYSSALVPVRPPIPHDISSNPNGLNTQTGKLNSSVVNPDPQSPTSAKVNTASNAILSSSSLDDQDEADLQELMALLKEKENLQQEEKELNVQEKKLSSENTHLSKNVAGFVDDKNKSTINEIATNLLKVQKDKKDAEKDHATNINNFNTNSNHFNDVKTYLSNSKVFYTDKENKYNKAQNRLSTAQNHLLQTQNRLSQTQNNLSQNQAKHSQSQAKHSQNQANLSKTQANRTYVQQAEQNKTAVVNQRTGELQKTKADIATLRNELKNDGLTKSYFSYDTTKGTVVSHTNSLMGANATSPQDMMIFTNGKLYLTEKMQKEVGDKIKLNQPFDFGGETITVTEILIVDKKDEKAFSNLVFNHLNRQGFTFTNSNSDQKVQDKEQVTDKETIRSNTTSNVAHSDSSTLMDEEIRQVNDEFYDKMKEFLAKNFSIKELLSQYKEFIRELEDILEKYEAKKSEENKERQKAKHQVDSEMQKLQDPIR